MLDMRKHDVVTVGWSFGEYKPYASQKIAKRVENYIYRMDTSDAKLGVWTEQ